MKMHWLIRETRKWLWLLRNGKERRVTIVELAEHTGIEPDTLRCAARDGRLFAVKSGKVWLSTPAAVERAVESGRLRRK